MHIMVDLEALSNDVRNGSLLAIGAIPFTMDDDIPYPNEADFIVATWEKAFYCPIDIVDQAKYKFEIDGDTLQWWLHDDRYSQLREFINARRRQPLSIVLTMFEEWVECVCPKKDDLQLWSHGSTYDCMHLAEKWPIVMMTSFNSVCPFRQVRDTRTLFEAYTVKFPGGSPYPLFPRKRHHHPLEDAWMQAVAVQRAWKGIING